MTNKDSLRIITASVRNLPIDSSLFENNHNPGWHSIFNIATSQGVAPLMFDAVNTLPSSYRPARAIMLPWCVSVDKAEQSNEKFNSTLKTLLTLSGNRDKLLLLKGISLSRLYPSPSRRICSDIDILALEDEFDNLYSELSHKGLNIHPEKYHVDTLYRKLRHKLTSSLFPGSVRHHAEFLLDGTMIELHHHLGRMYYPLYRNRFDKIIKSELSTGKSEISIGDNTINTLPPTLNQLYIFHHIYRHFFCVEGITLRQLYDLALFIEQNHDKVDKQKLTSYLKSLHLEKTYKSFCHILVTYLGLDSSLLPFSLTAVDAKWGEQILSDILDTEKVKPEEPTNPLLSKFTWFRSHLKFTLKYGSLNRRESWYYLYWKLLDSIFNLQRNHH